MYQTIAYTSAIIGSILLYIYKKFLEMLLEKDKFLIEKIALQKRMEIYFTTQNHAKCKQCMSKPCIRVVINGYHKILN